MRGSGEFGEEEEGRVGRALPDVAEYRLLLLDASKSMNEKIHGVSKILLAKEGLRKFLVEELPTYYPDWPLRAGVSTFCLKGVIGKPVMRDLVPIMLTPTRADLEKLRELKAEGGSPLAAALQHGYGLMKGIDTIVRFRRTAKRIKLISDGANDGPDPLRACSEMARSGIKIDCVEFSEKPSELMTRIASCGEGLHYCVRSVDELTMSLKLPRVGES